MRFLAVIIAILAALPALAQDSDLVTLQTRDASKGWEAVGRLDISGKGFCTAALIQPRLILTAAHCLFDNDNTPIDPSRFTFEAGLRDGRAAASRGVSRLLAHPDYVHNGPSTDTSEVVNDVAILELSQPIRNGRIIPYPIASQPQTGEKVSIVSYGKDRANAPSLQEVCSVMSRQDGILIMSCDVAFGSSGAPVFRLRNGQYEIVSVVSAKAEVEDQAVSVGTSLQQPLATLLTTFASQSTGGARKIIMSGERSESGAKFVRP
jgi:V8-like Glu-specific endopeptidase